MTYFKHWYSLVSEKLTTAGRLDAVSKSFNDQTNDFGRIQVVLKNLNKNDFELHENYIGKSKVKSENYRTDGNTMFMRKELGKALNAYTESICYAPQESIALALSYANRSAVLYELEKYSLCIADINKAFQTHLYPEKLHHKLWERLGRCQMKLNIQNFAEAFEMSLKTLSHNCDLKTEQKNVKARNLLKLMQISGQTDTLVHTQQAAVNFIYKVTAPSLSGANNIFPCATNSFSIVSDPQKGRHAVAVRDIQAGEVIIVEKPYSSVCSPTCFSTHCYSCLTRFCVGYPCRSCSSVRYCSVLCEEKSWHNFHQYECKYLLSLIENELGLAHLALKMVIETDFEKLKQTDSQMHNKSWTGLNEKGFFDSLDYHCVFSLIGNSDMRSSSDLFRKALIALYICRILQKSSFFDTQNKDKCNSLSLIATHIMKQLQMLPCNAHEVSELLLTGTGYANVELKEIGSAVYPTLSLLNHSCDPSVVRHSYGDTCVLRAIKFVKKGDELVDNYGFLYAVENKLERQKHILEQYYFNCSCHACENDWPLYDKLLDQTVEFKCSECCKPLLAKTEKCESCNIIPPELSNFSFSTENFESAMESVLDSGKIDDAQHEPGLSFIPWTHLVAHLERSPTISFWDTSHLIKMRRRTNNQSELNAICDNEQHSYSENDFLSSLNDTSLLNIALVVRIASVFVTQTYFVPDEYWQSTEVAHQHVFGYGHLTWEWRAKIRSYLHPFIFEIYFLLLKTLSIDYTVFVIYGPHFIQAIVTAYCDQAVYRVSYKLFHDKDIALNSYCLHLTCWFIFYTGSRTLSNTLEMCFTTVALSHLTVESRKSKRDSLLTVLFYAGISCIIRPSAICLWIFVMLYCIVKRVYYVSELITNCLKVFPALFVLSFGVDYYFYNEFVFVHLNFYQFNIVENFSEFYGVHSFYWYISQGLPVTLAMHSVFVCVGFWHSPAHLSFLLYAGAFYVFVLSFIPHKEFRFLLPALSLFLLYSGVGLKQLCKMTRIRRKTLILLCIVVNIVPALYFCLLHQRGVMDALAYTRRKEIVEKNTSVLFMMPCHSTPFYSYVHRNISMDILTCLPSKAADYVTEADVFYRQPTKWLSTNMQKVNRSTDIISFNTLPQEVLLTLDKLGFTKALSFFHTHFPEGRIGNYVDVYTKSIA